MTAEEVNRLVRAQIGDDWAHTNLHRVDLRSCLVFPRRIRAVDTSERDVEAWLVLHEGGAAEGLGWGVAFREDINAFTLVQFTKDFAPFLVNSHSTFFEALDAM